MPMARFFFGSVDGDWFIVPESDRSEWERMTLNDPSTDDEIEAFTDKFGEMRTGGGISGYSFIDPKEQI